MARSCYSEPVSASEGSCGRPRGKPQFAKDVRDVTVDGVLAEHEALGDIAIRETLCHQIEHLQLAPAQVTERGAGQLGRKRRIRLAELREHRLGAGALPVCSYLLELRDRGLDLAPCPIAASQRAQRCGEVEPHATALEGRVARRE